MATYAITLNERSAKGKALIEYLQALGVLITKVTPKTATKTRIYDPETGEYMNDRAVRDIEQALDDAKHGRVTTYNSVDEFFKEMGL
ncbi:MAG: hypothetical protein IJQ44_05845 [Bacteroidaceae bacterium]|nr:hypothetical protein [Bacteroidaceae bacterium]